MGEEVDGDGRRWAFYTIQKDGFTGSCLIAGKSSLKSNPHPAAASTHLHLFLKFPQQEKSTVSPQLHKSPCRWAFLGPHSHPYP